MPTVPTERTWADNDSLNTSNLNTGIKDPVAFLMDRPTCQARQTAAQSIASATFTPVTFGAEDVDLPAGHHDNVTNNSRFTAQYAGWHQLSGAVSWAANATNQRLAGWAVNGTIINGGYSTHQTTGINVPQTIARTMVVFLNVGDYVELHAWQNSGGALNTAVVTGEQSTMTATWLRRT